MFSHPNLEVPFSFWILRESVLEFTGLQARYDSLGYPFRQGYGYRNMQKAILVYLWQKGEQLRLMA
jgi:hypothetical protein